uniref:Methyltransferase small domain-containing protein n=1 Tax=Aplanochytrium stocchinoi TaxID=215587 RepID=A0A7S3LRV1_9STRA
MHSKDFPCTVCHGNGRTKRKQKNTQRHQLQRKKKIVRVYPPGSKPVCFGNALSGEELCSLVGHWRIFQQIGGHRWSTDDLVTAWYAGIICERYKLTPKTHLDLGCGIGSVLMMVSWQFENATSIGIEAQKLSAQMAGRSIRYNIGNSTRISVLHGDIRDNSTVNDYFDLITGTPPYFKVKYEKNGETGRIKLAKPGYGALPSCEQSAPARYEFRGGIEEYCLAAKSHLKKDGIFVVCEGLGPHMNEKRVLQGAMKADLKILQVINVQGREDKPPLFGVYAMTHTENDSFKPREEIEKLIVRHKGGKRTSEYEKLMLQMGIPP